MKTITKGLVGTVAAGAMALSSASPALARDNRNDHHGGVSAGDVIAGALVIGGIAAIVSAASSHHDRDRYDGYNGRYDGRYDNGNYDRRGYDGRYDRGYQSNPRQAVAMCVNAATQQANRYSYGGRANVTDIRDIDRNRDGFTVRGRIVVDSRGDYYRGRGWDGNSRGYDSGSFKCQVRYGLVVGLDFSGIRGL